MLVIKWSAKLLDIHIGSDVATDIDLDGAHSTRHYTKGNLGDGLQVIVVFFTLRVLVASSSTRVLRCQRWRILSPVKAFSVQV